MAMAAADLDRTSIESAYATIKPYIRVTPVLELSGADFGLAPFRLLLKLELTQHAGAFKTRGAFANLLLRSVPPAGVIAASGGNHGAAVAYAAMRLGIRARIFVPTVSSPAKIERIRGYGAELVVTGDRYGDALLASEAAVQETGALAVHAFDQRETMLGTGTVALELLAQQPGTKIDTVLAAVGGGGLLGGMAAYMRGETRLIGVEPEGAPTLTAALRAGSPVDAPTGSIAADSLAPTRVGTLMLPLAQRYVDRVLLVDDDDIRTAQQMLWTATRIVAEPGAATALAALVSRRYVPAPDETVAVVLSGANTTAVKFT
jgi:threonine dehydratase